MIFSGETYDTGRLGYNYATEYRKGFLIENRLITGCCAPSEYILFNKNTGSELVNYGPLIYYSENYTVSVIAYYRDDSIIIRNISTDKRNVIKLPKGLIAKAQEDAGQPAPEYVFNSKVNGEKLVITYSYLKPNTKNTWLSKSVNIDLSKYKEN